MAKSHLPVSAVFIILTLLTESRPTFAQDSESFFCNETETAYANKSCSKAASYILDGYLLDFKQSKLPVFTDDELSEKLKKWQEDPLNSPMCYFVKNITTAKCCDGWTGSNCNKVASDVAIANPDYSNPPTRYCYGSGRNFWKTFDGAMYYFEGCCSYTLLQDARRWISVKFTSCDFFSKSKELTIQPDGRYKVTAQCSKIILNDKEISVNNLNFGYAEGAIRISKVGDYFILKYGTLTVGWDCEGSWFIDLSDPLNSYESPDSFKGLCGNYDGDPSNDLNVNGKFVGIIPFGESKSFDYEACPSVQQYIPECKDKGVMDMSHKRCSLLSQDPFKACHEKYKPDSFVSRCMADYCLALEKNPGDIDLLSELVCEVFDQYSFLCGREGIFFEWRKDELCPKKCANPAMKYIENVSGCAPTCINMETTETCSTQKRYPGCVCSNGTLSDGVSCYLPKDCPCEFRGQTYASGETVPSDCNTCTCAFGTWQCTKNLCPATCSVIGLEHVTTFDGLYYTFKTPECEYVLAEARSPDENHRALKVSIATKNVGTENQTRPVALRLENRAGTANNVTVLVKIELRQFEILINDVPQDSSGTVISQDGITLMFVKNSLIITGDSFDIRVGNTGNIRVKLGTSYSGQTNGLCGNFNQKIDDEFTSRSGMSETKRSFVMSFSDCPDKSDQPEVGSPCTSNAAVMANQKIQEGCGLLKDSSTLGPICLAAPSKTSFHEACLNDLCVSINAAGLITDAPLPTVCDFIEEKATECLENGYNVYGWPNSDIIHKFCPEMETQCPSNLIYDLCPPALEKCRDISEASKLVEMRKICIPGCTCPKGQVLDDYGMCIDQRQCTCFDEATKSVLKSGESINRQCENCTCNSGNWECKAIEQSKSCAAGLVYQEQFYECGSTCDSYGLCYNNKPNCGGCACPDGKVFNKEGKCVVPSECPCEHKGSFHKPGEVVHSNGKVCICKNRVWQCKEDDSYRAQCKLFGDVYYIGFDNIHRVHLGQASCAYVLATTTTNTVEGSCEKLYISASNLPCGQSGVICSKVITVQVGPTKVVLAKGTSPIVNDIMTDLTSGIYANDKLSIVYTTVLTVVTFSNGLVIMHDGGTKVSMYLPICYKNKIDGLCGDLGGNSGSLTSPDAKKASDWKVDPTCPEPPEGTVFDPCKAHPERVGWATSSCTVITKGEAFKNCRKVVNFETYFQECMAASCDCDVGGDCQCMCTAIENFVSACNEQGICVNWRSNHFCPVMCPEGQVYRSCETPQNHTCHVSEIGLQENLVVEGCFCPEGTVLDENGKCVPREFCSCKAGGEYHPSGTVLKINCQTCTCREGKFCCTGTRCKPTCNTISQFSCLSDDTCVNISKQCDGVEDCKDGSDEEGCNECKAEDFQCTTSKECIGMNFKCDGHKDCQDGSDETDPSCFFCADGFFHCENKKCVPLSFRCDGKLDCGADDSSDELGCTTPQSTIPSASTVTKPKCIYANLLNEKGTSVQTSLPNLSKDLNSFKFPRDKSISRYAITVVPFKTPVDVEEIILQTSGVVVAYVVAKLSSDDTKTIPVSPEEGYIKLTSKLSVLSLDIQLESDAQSLYVEANNVVAWICKGPELQSTIAFTTAPSEECTSQNWLSEADVSIKTYPSEANILASGFFQFSLKDYTSENAFVNVSSPNRITKLSEIHFKSLNVEFVELAFYGSNKKVDLLMLPVKDNAFSYQGNQELMMLSIKPLPEESFPFSIYDLMVFICKHEEATLLPGLTTPTIRTTPIFCETTEWLEEGAKVSSEGVVSGNKFSFLGFDDSTLTISKDGTYAEITGITFLSNNVEKVDVFVADETGKIIHTFGKSIVGDVFSLTGKFAGRILIIVLHPINETEFWIEELSVKVCKETVASPPSLVPKASTEAIKCKDASLQNDPSLTIKTVPDSEADSESDKFKLPTSEVTKERSIIFLTGGSRLLTRVEMEFTNAQEVTLDAKEGDAIVFSLTVPLSENKFVQPLKVSANKLHLKFKPKDEGQGIEFDRLIVWACEQQFSTTPATTAGGTRCGTVNLFHDDKGIQVMTDPPTSGTLSSGPFSFEPLAVNPKIMYTLSSVRTVVNLEASAKNVGQILARISNKGEVKEYQKDSSKGEFKLSGYDIGDVINLEFVPNDRASPVNVTSVKVETCGEGVMVTLASTTPKFTSKR